MTSVTMQEQNDTFVQLPRAWMDEYLNKKLSFAELCVLVWLTWRANPYNGTVKTSYAEIASDFRGEYKKEHINKVMLSLKRKQYLWFPHMQGSRGSFMAEISNYRFSKDTKKDITHRFTETKGRSVAEEEQKPTESVAVLEENQSGSESNADSASQKLGTEIYKESKGIWVETEYYGRSPNNDKEKKNENNKSLYSGQLSGDKTNYGEQTTYSGVSTFIPRTQEEERCKEIAMFLREKSMGFILSRLKLLDHDMTKIEETYADTEKAALNSNDPNFNKGAYFNSVLTKKMQEAKLR